MLKPIRWIGLREYRQFFAEERRELRVRLRKQTRDAANLIAKAARKKIRAAFSGGSERRYDYGGQRKIGPGLLARAMRAKVRVKRDYQVTAWVGVSAAKKYFPAALYAPALEEGGTIQRRGRTLERLPGQGRGGKAKLERGRPHTATYRARPFFDPALRETQSEVFATIGKTFRVPR